MTTAYPLSWPLARPRTPAPKRRVSPFSTTRESNTGWKRRTDLSVSGGIQRLVAALERLGARHIVISSNVEQRNDGYPRSSGREPDDPGVAVYFDLKDKPICMPCDTYTKVAGNLAAVAAHIDATRMIERHGVASIAEMFSGFAMLTAPGAAKPWWEVLQCRSDASTDVIQAQFRRLARDRHPDNGGSNEVMAELSAARDQALRQAAEMHR